MFVLQRLLLFSCILFAPFAMIISKKANKYEGKIFMRRAMFLVMIVCLLLTGCGKSGQGTAADTQPAETQPTETPKAETETKPEPAEPVVQQEPSVTVEPLPDTTMESLDNAAFAASLEEGDAYVDDAGIMQMAVTVYSYDQYDLAQIAGLKVGDSIVTYAGAVEVNTLERTGGTVIINGGLEAGGMELVADESTIFYETERSGARKWHKVGEATLRVSADFVYYDRSDPEKEEIFYPGSFLVGEVTDYHFTPYNTTIRVEEGQVVEMIRVYVP